MYAWIGWVATVVVAVSYVPRNPRTLRRIQAAGACLWLLYGIMIHSNPVIAANVIVAGMALVSSFRRPVAQPAAE